MLIDAQGRVLVTAEGRVALAGCDEGCCGGTPGDLFLVNCEVRDCGVLDVLIPADTIVLRLTEAPRCANADGSPGRLLAPGDVVEWAGICWRVSQTQTLDGPLLQRSVFPCRSRCDDAVCTATKYLPVVPCPATEQLTPPPNRTGWICAARALNAFRAGRCPMVDVPINDAYTNNPGTIGGLPPGTPTLCYQALLTDAVLDDELPPNALILDDVSPIHDNCCQCSARYDRCTYEDFTGQANWVPGDSVCCIDCDSWSATSEFFAQTELFYSCTGPTSLPEYQINREQASAVISNSGTVQRTWAIFASEDRCNGTTNLFVDESGSDSFNLAPCDPNSRRYLIRPRFPVNISYDELRVTTTIRTTCREHTVRVQGDYTDTSPSGDTVRTVVDINHRVLIAAQQGDCGPSSCVQGDPLSAPQAPIVPPDGPAGAIDQLNAMGML